MIVHVVLFRPRADLTAAHREALAQAFVTAVGAIPSVRRARTGRRVLHGRGYEQLMAASHPFAVLLEFEDLTGLQAYLNHPAHEALATRFFEIFEEALIYDYEFGEGPEAALELR